MYRFAIGLIGMLPIEDQLIGAVRCIGPIAIIQAQWL